MRIYFARHGQSQANTLREMSTRGLKHPLTQTGRAQAADLVRRLEGRSISQIYSSPVLRAIETTVIVANQLGVDYEVAEALREYDVGNLEGRADEQAWQIWQELFDDWAIHRRWDRRIEGGETFHEVQNRFVPFVDDLIQKHGHADANLLCVAHGGLYWMMLPVVLKNVDTAFIDEHRGFDYTALVVAELRPEGLLCVEWNGEAL
ncbi:MAG: histidine phosphatase family protein [Kouleothrix sp.]|nr:histidine phosphatase family protein [Kouleothrix sp.]